MPQYGPVWPLKKGDQDTFEQYETPKDQINYYLKSLLLTNKGENLSDPIYGVGIRNYLFEQNTPDVAGTLESEIRRQIRIYLPYLTIRNIQMGTTPDDIDNNKIRISIAYTIPRNVNEIVFELDLNSDQTIGFY